MGKREELTDEQWAISKPFSPKVVPDGRDRSMVHGDLAVMPPATSHAPDLFYP